MGGGGEEEKQKEKQEMELLEIKCNYNILKSLSEIMSSQSVHCRSMTLWVITF